MSERAADRLCARVRARRAFGALHAGTPARGRPRQDSRPPRRPRRGYDRPIADTLLAQLDEYLRIPSISTGVGDPRDLVRAAEWVAERVQAAGGSCDVVAGDPSPLVIGELRARRADAATVLIYGHYDVQGPEPVADWSSPPFEPTVRDGRLYARGASDDKGNFLPLLYVACELAHAGELPVHVRVIMDGEEEIGGHRVADWLLEDERGADCAVIFDSGMHDERTPELCLGARGMVQLRVEVQTAARDLHSGIYGGAIENAAHVITRMIAAVAPGPDGVLRDELCRGVAEPSPRELESWPALRPAEADLDTVGARAVAPMPPGEFVRRTWAEPSLDVNGLASGDAGQLRTQIPARAQAVLSMRLASGQDPTAMHVELERLLRAAAPASADVAISLHGRSEAVVFDPETRAIRLAADAIGRACGVPPALARSGGSIPALAGFAQRDIPAVVSGFALPEDRIHAPDESFRLESLRLGERSARELYTALAALADS